MRQPEPSAPPPLAEPDVPHYARLPLLGAWAKFSVKLLLDSMLDLVLMPAAFGAVALGILRGGDEPDRYFRALMLFGRRVEHFVNLFGNRKAGSVDDVLGDYEQQVADAFERRGWSRKAEAVLRIPDRSTPSTARPPPPAATVDTAEVQAPGVDAAAVGEVREASLRDAEAQTEGVIARAAETAYANPADPHLPPPPPSRAPSPAGEDGQPHGPS